LDRDPTVLPKAEEFKKAFPERFDFTTAKFSQLREVLDHHGVAPCSVSGVVIDCGCSSMQMDSARGFSHSHSPSAPLDMRMNPSEADTLSAVHLVNTLDVPTLARIFKHYGEEKNAMKIATAISDYRYQMKQIRTTGELSGIVEAAFSEGHERTDSLGRKSGLATKVFMALRIFVNDELNQLNRGLLLVYEALRIGGRAAVISFHSLEDRIVKRHFAGIDMNEPVSRSISQKYRNSAAWHSAEELEPKWGTIHRLVLPSEAEILMNPRSRSAKLRVSERTF